MFIKVISRGLPVAIIVVTAFAWQPMSSDAKAGIHDLIKLDQTGCMHCPACDYRCKLDAEIVDEEKSCFDVETKVICIPRVVFPWQRKKCLSCSACDGQGCTNCVNNGARVRKICVLKTDSYKCPKCKYSWSAEKKACLPESSRVNRADSAGSAKARGDAFDLPQRRLSPTIVDNSSQPKSAESGTISAGEMAAGAAVKFR